MKSERAEMNLKDLIKANRSYRRFESGVSIEESTLRELVIAAQSIILGATEKGLGGCIVGSIKRDAPQKALQIPEHFEILLVIALGKPAETFMIEDVGADGDIKYWRDENGVHHVPKRSLDDLIVSGKSSP